MLKRALLFAAVGVLLLFAASYISSVDVWQRLDGRALFLVLAYTSILVLAKYSPGRCMYRFLVLNDPERHLEVEVERASAFASYVGTRILFAGLIFTLVDIARVMAANDDLLSASGALSMALSASLYSLALYFLISRTGEAALGTVRTAATRA